MPLPDSATTTRDESRPRSIRACATAEAAQRLQQDVPALPAQLEITARDEIARRLPAGSVHQGLAAQVAPLPELFLGDLVAQATDNSVVVVLDQVRTSDEVGVVGELRDAVHGAAGHVDLHEEVDPLLL